MSISVVFLTGALLIFIYALERFNTPPTNRSSTTWFRYHVAALVYVGLFEVTFALITRYPALLGYLQGLAPSYDDALLGLAGAGDGVESSTVGVALVLSVLVPKVPGLARVDRWLRGTLQRAAAIPHEARRFAKSIRDADFAPDEALSDRVDAWYANRGLAEILSAGNDQVAAGQIHKLTAMMLRMEEWMKDRRFAGFLQERQEQRIRLKERYDRVIEMAKGYFQLPDQEMDGADGAVLSDATLKFRNGFRDELNGLVLEAAELVSHTLLRCCVRSAPRFAELREMGLVSDDRAQQPAVNADQIMLLLGSLVSVLLLYSVLVSDPRQIESLSKIAMVPIIYTVAVICAVLPKQKWRLFQRGTDDAPPALGYTLAGLAAMTFAFCIAILFRVLLEIKDAGPIEAIASAWKDFYDNSVPWLLMSFVTCVATAAVIDSTHIRAVTPETRRRWIETGILAVVISATGALVWWLLQGVRPPEDLPELYRVVPVSAIIGGLIGYMVPYWYRGSPAQGAEQYSQADRRPEAFNADGQGLRSA